MIASEHEGSPERTLRSAIGQLGRTRRTFLSALAGVGAAALAGGRAARAQSTGVTDIDILNFALNLEYLGSEYYTYATTGSGIEALGIPVTGTNTGGGNPGPIIIKSNPMVPFVTANIKQYAADLALDEQKHLMFLRNTLMSLGATPVARPTLDLMTSYNALSSAAGLGSSFDPFLNETNFLLGAYILEDVCVTAVHGAVTLIQSKAVLAGGGGLLGVESYQAAMIRTKLYQLNQGPATNAISNLRRMLGGSVDYGVADGPLNQGPSGTSSIVLTDNVAMVGARTPRQILNIAYGMVNATSGGFFPAALNGNIR